MLLFERARIITFLCLSVIGCTGNLLTLLIVNRRFFRKTASASFISGVCIADCLVLCLDSLQIVTKLHPHVTSYDCAVFFLMDVFRSLSIWIVCLINIERCSLVCNPCRMPRLTSRLKARLIVVVLFIVSLLIFSHYGQHMNIEYVYSKNQSAPVRSFCAFKPDFHRLLWESIRSALTYWSTVPICLICNIIIIQRLYQATRIERTWNSQSPNGLYLSSKQRQLTSMLVAASICFVSTATPSTIHRIYLLTSNNLSSHQYIIHIVTNILLHFHHTSNFVVFMLSSARFRLELIELIRVYLRCQIYAQWHKRSTPATEQIFIHSTRHVKLPMKLLASKSNVRRYTHAPQSPNGIHMLANHQLLKRTQKTYNYGIHSISR
jgi:hypothetical protein